MVFPEGRHPQGRTILDSRDLVAGTRFPDWVVANLTADIELPGMEGIEEAPSVRAYDIPYRALTPVRVKNLLLCGRCISGTHRAHGSFRALQPTLATGQAAGHRGLSGAGVGRPRAKGAGWPPSAGDAPLRHGAAAMAEGRGVRAGKDAR